MNKQYLGKSPEQILAMLTLRQKAAQTIVPNYANPALCLRYVEEGMGGIWPTWHYGNNSTTEEFRLDMARLNEMADIPLFISADMETGVGQLIHYPDQCTEFPELMALGAIADEEEAEDLAYRMGVVMGHQARRIGWNMSPTPVVDVNIRPENPITNIRSVGDNPAHVARVTSALIRGMQSENAVIPMAKHFPGAGMHRADSHFDLERMQVTEQEMDQVHLVPFNRAFEADVQCVMTNHAIYPAYDDVNVSTLSKAVMTDLLRKRLGYHGLAMTDAMGMEGVMRQASGHLSTIRALVAGNDLILAPYEPLDAIDAIVQAVGRGDELTEAILDAIVLRILRGKAWLGLFDPIQKHFDDARVEEGRALARQIARKSVTLIRDLGQLPMPIDGGRGVLVLEPAHPRKQLEFGLYTNTTMIYDAVSHFAPDAEFMLFPAEVTDECSASLADAARRASLVVIGTSFRSYAGQVGLLTTSQVALLKRIAEANEHVAAVISNPYVAAQIPTIRTVLCCYSTARVAVEAAVDALRGVYRPVGRTPVHIPEALDASGIKIVCHD